mmetsp:Transcript_37723/g.82586  ORF Transcript_37723/g.82586 Transcript_37723/m.82586 type:complete len:131 (+) Transcript_37723:148-540(+)
MRQSLFFVVVPAGAILSSPVSFVQLALLADDVPDDDIENRVLVQSPEEQHRRALIEVAATAPEVEEEIPAATPKLQKLARVDTATLLSAASVAHTQDSNRGSDEDKKPLLSAAAAYRFGIGEKLVTMWAR